jgi:capsid protein
MAEQYQSSVVVHQFCRPIYSTWFDLALLSGALELPRGMALTKAKRAKWSADPWDYLNPLQEVNVDIKKIRAGLKSRTECIREWGRDTFEVERQIAEERQREKDAGLIFDSNPEAVSLAGIAQNIDPTNNFLTEEEKIEIAGNRARAQASATEEGT